MKALNKTMILIVSLCLLLSCQPDEKYSQQVQSVLSSKVCEQVLHRMITAMKDRDWDSYVEMLHPQILIKIKETLIPVAMKRNSFRKDILGLNGGRKKLRERLNRIHPKDICKRLLSNASEASSMGLEVTPFISFPFFVTSIDVMGQVKDKDITYVIYRLNILIKKKKYSCITKQAFKLYKGEWRSLLTWELEDAILYLNATCNMPIPVPSNIDFMLSKEKSIRKKQSVSRKESKSQKEASQVLRKMLKAVRDDNYDVFIESFHPEALEKYMLFMRKNIDLKKFKIILKENKAQVVSGNDEVVIELTIPGMTIKPGISGILLKKKIEIDIKNVTVLGSAINTKKDIVYLLCKEESNKVLIHGFKRCEDEWKALLSKQLEISVIKAQLIQRVGL